jgi:hypothetical protein
VLNKKTDFLINKSVLLIKKSGFFDQTIWIFLSTDLDFLVLLIKQYSFVDANRTKK